MKYGIVALKITSFYIGPVNISSLSRMCLTKYSIYINLSKGTLYEIIASVTVGKINVYHTSQLNNTSIWYDDTSAIFKYLYKHREDIMFPPQNITFWRK